MNTPPSEWTVLIMLKWGTSYFEEKKVRNPRFSIEWLLAYILEVKRLDIYLMYDRPLVPEELKKLRPLVKRRSQHEPLQYITGKTDFLNATLKVAPGVLIPRMETEQLVEMILEEEPSSEKYSVLDIGTGSGCIPIALKIEREEWDMYATDISKEALEIAKENAKINEVEVTFIEDDVLNSSAFSKKQRFDLIISNPPYILEEEENSLDREVKEFEPASALFCKSTAAMYGAIEEFANQYLVKEGNLYLELHERHAQEVKAIFNSPKWDSLIHQDYDKKERFLVSKKIK
ncbi:MAG: peptide chain release factor N(5)-glutamine methyltransferase [Balneolaceae bacterium]